MSDYSKKFLLHLRTAVGKIKTYYEKTVTKIAAYFSEGQSEITERLLFGENGDFIKKTVGETASSEQF